MKYVIERFAGLQQQADEHLLPASATPDAVNMSAEEQDLKVAAGYAPYASAALSGGIDTLAAYYRRSGGTDDTRLLAANSGGLYEWRSGEWARVCDVAGGRISTVNYQHDGRDVLLIADGSGSVREYDGTAVTTLSGSPEDLSLLTLHYERIWGSGAAGNPDAVFYSRAFSPDDWSGDTENPESGGGEIQLPTFNGGRVLAIENLFDDVLVFKERDIYRIVGTYPGDYEVVRVHGVTGPLARNSIVSSGNMVYYLSAGGLCGYNGVSATPFSSQPAKGFLKRINRQAADRACAAVFQNRLFLAAPLDGAAENNAVLEMDLGSGRMMVRSGIEASAFLVLGEKLLFAGSDGIVYEYGCGADYNGTAISAYWRTPWTDMGNQTVEKYLDSLYLIGSGTLEAVLETDRHRQVCRLNLGAQERPARIKLQGHGRRFRLTLRNVDGSAFHLRDGLQITMDDP